MEVDRMSLHSFVEKIESTDFFMPLLRYDYVKKGIKTHYCYCVRGQKTAASPSASQDSIK